MYQEDLCVNSVSGRKLQKIKKAHLRSHNAVNCSMRSPFKVLLKTNEICYKTIYQGHLTLGREQSCPRLASGVINRRILAAQPMRRGIGEGEAVGQCARGDLIVIVGVTPTSDPARSVRVPESAILKIRCV